MSSPCCPPDSLGAAKKFSYETKGSDIVLPASTDRPSMPCYITGDDLDSIATTPTTTYQHPQHLIVLLFTDVFGIDKGHHKAAADRMVELLSVKMERKVTVLIPDFFRGSPLVVAKQISWWFPVVAQIVFRMYTRVTPQALKQDLANVVMPWLESRMGVKLLNEIGVHCIGFCFGGWLVARALAWSRENEARFPIRSGVGLHPSWRMEALINSTPEKLAELVGTKPILLLPARNDDLKPGCLAVDTLAKARGLKPDDVSIEFPTMLHGFVTRGDLNDADVCANRAKALDLAVDFISKH